MSGESLGPGSEAPAFDTEAHLDFVRDDLAFDLDDEVDFCASISVGPIARQDINRARYRNQKRNYGYRERL